MPTKQELDNLNSNCDWTWITTNGVNGYIIHGRGGYASNSIFIPASGRALWGSLASAGSTGWYWSSVPSSESIYSWFLNFSDDYHKTSDYFRKRGGVVRPVQGFTE